MPNAAPVTTAELVVTTFDSVGHYARRVCLRRRYSGRSGHPGPSLEILRRAGHQPVDVQRRPRRWRCASRRCRAGPGRGPRSTGRWPATFAPGERSPGGSGSSRRCGQAIEGDIAVDVLAAAVVDVRMRAAASARRASAAARCASTSSPSAASRMPINRSGYPSASLRRRPAPRPPRRSASCRSRIRSSAIDDGTLRSTPSRRLRREHLAVRMVGSQAC